MIKNRSTLTNGLMMLIFTLLLGGYFLGVINIDMPETISTELLNTISNTTFIFNKIQASVLQVLIPNRGITGLTVSDSMALSEDITNSTIRQVDAGMDLSGLGNTTNK
ncbi:hypothetical protein HYX12_03970 [Candidatus Woesearchaeota archaeon]|nr:hypothetical protein [Candidatus Woesearchaeota archaeon]